MYVELCMTFDFKICQKVGLTVACGDIGFADCGFKGGRAIFAVTIKVIAK